MNRTSQHIATRNDRGFVIVAMLALVAALLGTGVAFMQWATDESVQGRHAEAKMQAYYCAQAGVLERGLTWLYQQQAGLMPRTETPLGDGVVTGIGRYVGVKVSPVFGSVDDNLNFSFDEKYRVQAYGIVQSPWEDGVEKADTAKAVLYVQVRSFVDYMYLTDKETSLTFEGDIIRFFGRDTLWGRTHSNDWIATQNVNGLPVFYDIVSTTKPSFRPGSPNPAGQFFGGAPRFNSAAVKLPELAESIRANAIHLEVPGDEWRCLINGLSATFYHWPEGTEFDPNSAQSTLIPCAPSACVFVHGRLEILGEMANQGCRLTVGCERDIHIIDNVMLQGTNMTNGTLATGATSIIGIVGEEWIYIQNTLANGREGCAGQYTNHGRCHIVLTAAIVALGQSFQFDQMNDVNDPYISPIQPDERGNIVMTGSITQRWRGYVHRSNVGGSGYNKVYHYDNRFKTQRPPCFLGATDEDGRVLLNVVQWGQASEDPVDVAAQKRVRYN